MLDSFLRESEGEEMGNAEGCCGLRSSDQVHENDSSMYNREKRKFIVRYKLLASSLEHVLTSREQTDKNDENVMLTLDQIKVTLKNRQMYHRKDEILQILRESKDEIDTKEEMYSEIDLCRAIESFDNSNMGQNLFNEAMTEKKSEITSTGMKVDTPWHFDAGYGMEGSEGNRHITDEDL